ncbi:hypothetical protein GF420_08640 [candidate division GN15 bacterium]|jgi:hypothetical protein|nr:hypothetical protein [candidate division GN15 bacterium]
MKRFTIATLLSLALLLSASALAQDGAAPHYKSYDSAMAAAKAQGKKVFVDFYTDW